MKKMILGAAGMLLSGTAMAQQMPVSDFNLASVKSRNLITSSLQLAKVMDQEEENQRYRIPASDTREERSTADMLEGQARGTMIGMPQRGGRKVNAGFMLVADGKGTTADLAVAGKPLSQRLAKLNRP